MNSLPRFSKEDRPWGCFERYTFNEPSTVKIITVNAGEAFSLQKHAKRTEFWKILSGSGTVTAGEKQHAAHAGDEFMIESGMLHRVEAGTEPVVFLEIALGEFDEADIVRLEDRYGRK